MEPDQRKDANIFWDIANTAWEKGEDFDAVARAQELTGVIHWVPEAAIAVATFPDKSFVVLGANGHAMLIWGCAEDYAEPV